MGVRIQTEQTLIQTPKSFSNVRDLLAKQNETIPEEFSTTIVPY